MAGRQSRERYSKRKMCVRCFMMFAALGVVGAKVRKSGYFPNLFVRGGFEKSSSHAMF